MQAEAVHIATVDMVSNVQKPAPPSRLPATTNGAPAKVLVSNNVGAGVEQKILPSKIVKKLHRNGVVNGCGTEHGCRLSPSPPPPPTFTNNQLKTKGAHSSDEGSSTLLSDHSQCRRLVCPELAISYTGTLMSTRAGHLVSSQRDLELQFSTLSRIVREKQMKSVHSHARKQLHFQDKSTSAELDPNGSDLSRSLDSTKSDSVSSDTSNDVHSVKLEPMDTEGPAKNLCEQPLPIQVDGASDEHLSLASLSLDQADTSNLGEISKELPVCPPDKDDVFRKGNESHLSASECHDKASGLDDNIGRIQQQLVGLKNMLDNDVTDSSSDEEEESPQISRYAYMYVVLCDWFKYVKAVCYYSHHCIILP